MVLYNLTEFIQAVQQTRPGMSEQRIIQKLDVLGILPAPGDVYSDKQLDTFMYGGDFIDPPTDLIYSINELSERTGIHVNTIRDHFPGKNDFGATYTTVGTRMFVFPPDAENEIKKMVQPSSGRPSKDNAADHIFWDDGWYIPGHKNSKGDTPRLNDRALAVKYARKAYIENSPLAVGLPVRWFKNPKQAFFRKFHEAVLAETVLAINTTVLLALPDGSQLRVPRFRVTLPGGKQI